MRQSIKYLSENLTLMLSNLQISRSCNQSLDQTRQSLGWLLGREIFRIRMRLVIIAQWLG
jgi:hypothetical protein